MVFTENIKKEVKRNAHYKCCFCESFGFLDVHHIIPQGKGGTDTIDNAIALCVKCHDDFGANPQKRRGLKEKRDFWYRFCEEKLYNEDVNKLEEIHKFFEKMQTQSEERIKNTEKDIQFLQKAVQDLTNKNQQLVSSLNTISAEQKPELFAQIGSTSSAITSTASAMTQLGSGIYANPICSHCGSAIGLYISNQPGTPICPSCGALMT